MIKRVVIGAFSGAAGALLLVLHFGFPGYFHGGGNTSKLSATISSGLIVTNLQPAHGFVMQSASGTQVDDRGEYMIGNQSLRISTNGSGQW